MLTLKREISEKVRNFFFRHLSRMPFAVIDDEALDLVDIRLLSADGIMLASEDVRHLFEQFWFARRRHSH
jgi:hypothetical protein